MIHKPIGALIAGLFGSLAAAVFADMVGEPGVALIFQLCAIGFLLILTLSMALPVARKQFPRTKESD